MAMIRVSDDTHKKVKALAETNNESIDGSISELMKAYNKHKEKELMNYEKMSDEEKHRYDLVKKSRNEFYLQKDLIMVIGLYNDDREFVSKTLLFNMFKDSYHDISYDRAKEIINTIIYPLLED